MRIGIHQPNYIPWLGYFRKIALCDIFVFFDNVQMPGGKSFVSRNEIKTPNGRLWLTVPVADKGEGTLISDAGIADQRWPRKHLKTLEINYSASSWKSLIRDELAPILEAGHTSIADLNCALIEKISRLIGLKNVEFVRATGLDLRTKGAESIGGILENLEATEYWTGSGAGSMRHLDADELAEKGIKTSFVSASFPNYCQFHGDFEGSLSALDALLCLGPDVTRELLYANAREQ
jgi:hypothetical protein